LERSEDLLKDADDSLGAAKDLLTSGRWAKVCFHCLQAAELALKAEADKSIRLLVEYSKPFQPRTIILFGSYARGDFTESSDIDLCLIADKMPKEELPRRTLPDMPKIPKLKVIGFLPEEFLEYIRTIRFLAFDIVADGIIIYDDGLYRKIREAFDDVIRTYGICRQRHGWKISSSPTKSGRSD